MAITRDYARRSLEKRMKYYTRNHRVQLTDAYVGYRASLRFFGHRLGELIHSKDAEEICELFDSAPGYISTHGIWNTVRDKHSELLDEYHECSNCSNHVYDDYFQPTDENELICEDCQQGGSFSWSEEMQCWISNRRARRFYATQRMYDRGDWDYITNSYAHRNDIYWNDTADGFIGEDVYIEPDEEEPEYSRQGLREYHNTRRTFNVSQRNPHAIYRSMPPLGLELELWSPDRGCTVDGFRNDFVMIGELIMETDGSLDKYHGMELVTDPLGYDEWRDIGPAMCAQAVLTNCVAYNHPDTNNNYGIHITLHRSYLSPLQEARMFLFTVALENADFIRVIAQRASIYHADIEIGAIGKSDQNIRCVGGLQHQMAGRKIMGRGKYAPINFKDHLAEIRIFQATLHSESFMKNLEFVWALVEWLKNTSGSSWHHEKFVCWFCAQPQARAHYPHLWLYLKRPSYRVKNHPEVIRNTWLEFYPAPPRPKLGESFVVIHPADDMLLAA